MKVMNNLNMDLKEEIDTLQNELGKLKIYKDDMETRLAKHLESIEKEVKDKVDFMAEETKMAR